MNSNFITYIRNDRIVEIKNSDSNETLLNYIREKLKKTGSKEGCAEGGCGACTVVIGELKGNEISYSAINSCITFLPTLQGKQLILVEDLISKDGELHLEHVIYEFYVPMSCLRSTIYNYHRTVSNSKITSDA